MHITLKQSLGGALEYYSEKLCSSVTYMNAEDSEESEDSVTNRLERCIDICFTTGIMSLMTLIGFCLFHVVIGVTHSPPRYVIPGQNDT